MERNSGAGAAAGFTRRAVLSTAGTLAAGAERPTSEETGAFWRETLARLSGQPAEAVEEAVNDRTAHRTFRVALTGLGGVRFRCLLALPIEGETGARRWPGLVSLPGYSGFQQGVALSECQRGYAVLQVFPRGQGISAELAPVAGEKLTAGLAQPEGYYYQGAYCDVVRAVDYLMGHPAVDGRRIACAGTSQGGGMALAAAAIDARIRVVTAHVPFLCDLRRAYGIRGSLAQRLLSAAGVSEAGFRTLDYFDPLVLAPGIRAAVLMTAGGKDETCPEETIRAVFDRIAAAKSYSRFPELAHTSSRLYYAMSWVWLEQHLAVV